MGTVEGERGCRVGGWEGQGLTWVMDGAARPVERGLADVESMKECFGHGWCHSAVVLNACLVEGGPLL